MLATFLWGGVLIALLTGSMVTLVRRFIGRFGLPLVIISLIWLTWQFLEQGAGAGLVRPVEPPRQRQHGHACRRSTW